MAVVSINVNDNDKNSFSSICSELGMNVTTAINIFIKAVNRTHSIPFNITTNQNSQKKELTSENINKMMALSEEKDFEENPASIETLKEFTKNDVW